MTDFIEVLKALPALIWSLVGATALWLVAPHVGGLFPRLQSFEGFGLKMSLQALDQAVKARAAPLSGADTSIAADRLKREGKRLDGAEILWIDDMPSNNRHEARIFQSLGANVTFAASSEEAERLLDRMRVHLIISDISRGGVPDEGIRFLQHLRNAGVIAPLLFYTSQARQPPPEGAQGVADLPAHLVSMVLDTLAPR